MDTKLHAMYNLWRNTYDLREIAQQIRSHPYTTEDEPIIRAIHRVLHDTDYELYRLERRLREYIGDTAPAGDAGNIRMGLTPAEMAAAVERYQEGRDD